MQIYNVAFVKNDALNRHEAIFKYNPTIIGILKRHGWRFDGATKRWWSENGPTDEVRELLNKEGVETPWEKDVVPQEEKQEEKKPRKTKAAKGQNPPVHEPRAKLKFFSHFDTMEDFLHAMQTTKFHPQFRERASIHRDRNFTGTDTYEEALDLARWGWPEGTQRMQQAVDAIASSTAVQTVMSTMHDVAGAYPIAAYAAAGDPMCMVAPGEVLDSVRPVVRLYVSNTARANTEVESIMNYGAVVLSVVDALESGGFRVEITQGSPVAAFMKDNLVGECQIILKNADDALDIEKLSFALAHPSMLRRLQFRWRETHTNGDFELGYGVPVQAKQGREYDADQVALPAVDTFDAWQLETPEKAYKYVMPIFETALRDRFQNLPPLTGTGEAA